jgi:hypothetical protein
VKPPSKAALALFAVAALALGGCATTQSTAFPIGDRIHPPKPAAAVVQIFKDSNPTRKYEPVARLNVHLEKTFFIQSAFEEARPQLEDLARRAGADAVIQVEEKKTRLNETFIYNVSATAVVFTE